jgi:hypothetical protein
MNISIPLTPDVEAKLRLRAEAAGKDLGFILSDLIKLFAHVHESAQESNRDDQAK